MWSEGCMNWQNDISSHQCWIENRWYYHIRFIKWWSTSSWKWSFTITLNIGDKRGNTIYSWLYVSSVPGVMRINLLFWLRGPFSVKISQKAFTQINDRLKMYQEFIPKEFARINRFLSEINKWIATKFRHSCSSVEQRKQKTFFPVQYITISCSNLLAYSVIQTPIYIAHTNKLCCRISHHYCWTCCWQIWCGFYHL